MNNERIVIIGAGALGVLALDILLACRFPGAILFADDTERMQRTRKHNIPVAGPIDPMMEQWAGQGGTRFIIAIGDNARRQQIVRRFPDLRFLNAIHPQAVISPLAVIGTGNIILPGAVIDPEAEIGDHVIVNKCSSIGHNAVVECFAQVAHGVRIGGFARLKSRSFVGLGASVLPHTTVGEDAVVGAGAVVIRDIPDRCTAVGVPAEPVNRKQAGG